MTVRPLLRQVLIAGALCLGPVVHAADLAEVYQRALRNDPQIREAEANRLAALESKPQALAALLPQISADGGWTKDDSDGSSVFLSRTSTGDVNLARVASSARVETTRWEISLRQNLFNWANWVALRRANSEVAQAESDYRAAQQDLVLRAAERYLGVLAARDTVDAAAATQEAIARQLEQAEKRFEVGLIAVTDVQEARAARDQANANLIQSKRQLATEVERLRELTGESFAELSAPVEDLPLKAPDPASAEDWVKLAMEQNARLVSSRLAADVARENIAGERSGHLPQVDLVLAKSDTETDGTRVLSGIRNPSDTDNNDKSISIQVTVPIFSGGATASRVREASYRHRAARERLEQTARQTELDTRDAYLGVMSEISRVQALKQALESARTALAATEAGYEVGTRTAVDVLDARRRQYEAQTNYLGSRYDYLVNVLKLRLAAGMLDAASITEVNGWLGNAVSVN
ncbi:MAG: TolC family outer membrane protein [Steroidobacteraceae bacterium]